MKTITRVKEVFEEAGAVITGSHVVYTSGRHGSAYVNKDAIYPYTDKVSFLCTVIADHFYHERINVDAVIAPAIGGTILAQYIAKYLGSLMVKDVFAVYAEKVSQASSASYGPIPSKSEDMFAIKRGYDRFIRGKDVLVAEDILTTGGTARSVIEQVRINGGNVVGLGALCNRGKVTTKMLGDIPHLFSLMEVDLESWAEADCPLCAQKVPINTEVGKGKEFLARVGQAA